MKKLLMIAILMLALVFTAVACTVEEDPADDTTVADNTTVENPTEAPTTEPDEPEETTAAPQDEETTVPVEPEETTEGEKPTDPEPEETTEPETADPADPVWIMDADALAGMTNANAATVEKNEEGYASFTATGGDPWFLVTGNIGAMPEYMVLRYRTNTTQTGEFFIGNGAGPEGGQSFTFEYNADGEWNLLVFHLPTVAPYMTDNTVGHIRYDFYTGGPEEGAYLDVAYIAFFHTAEYAILYANAPILMEDAASIAGKANGNNVGEFMTEGDKSFAHLTTVGEDPWFMILNGANAQLNYLAVAYRTNGTSIGEFFVGSGTSPQGGVDEVFVDWNEDENWNLLVIDLSASGVSSITDGIVNYLRLDPFLDHVENRYLDIQYVAFFESVAAAEAYYAVMNPPKTHYDNYNVPQENWEVSGHKPGITSADDATHGGMVATGGLTTGALLHQGAIGVGEIDLSKYDKVVVYCGCDATEVTQGHYNNNANNRIILSKVDTNNNNSPAEEDIIASVTYTLHGWAPEAVEIDLSGIDYNGPVYVTYDTLPDTFMLVGAIEFIGGKIPAEELETPDERVNIALNKPATATSTQDSHVAQNATDGNMSTRWASNPKDTCDLIVDLEAVYALDEIELILENALMDYTISVSEDGENYTVVVEATREGWLFVPTSRTFDLNGATGRYVKLTRLQDDGSTDFWFSIWELNIYGKAVDTAPEA